MNDTVETQQKYYKVADVSKMYGIPAETVREMCHATDQNFAFRIGTRSNFLIDAKRFGEYLKTKMSNKTEEPKTLYTVKDVSKMYGVSEDIVRDWCKKRNQRFAFREGDQGSFRIDIKRLDEYIERRMTRT